MTTRPGASPCPCPPGTGTPAHETCALRRLEVLHDADLSPRRHRQPRRARDAAHPRGARAEREGAPLASHRALHRARAPRPVRPRGRRGRLPRTGHFLDPRDGSASRLPRLRRLERALPPPGADAAWVGWGFVAEHAAFAELCERLGVVFIGPSAEAMRRLGDKIGSKLLAEEAGVPGRALERRRGRHARRRATARATRIGYPLMLKAAAGGGGRGIRVVAAARPSSPTPSSAPRDEAQRAFGDGTVFLERLVTGARHVEVQVIADSHGTSGRSACATAPCSAATRRSSRSRPRPRSPPRRTTALRDAAVAPRARGRLPQRRHRRVPLRPGAAVLRSWRSTPACRSSTRSPR